MKKNNLITLVISLVLIAGIFSTIFIGNAKNNKSISYATNPELQSGNKKDDSEEVKIDENSKKEEVKKDRFEGMQLKDNKKGVPVIFYHSIEASKDNELKMSKEKFRKEMQYLKDNKYTTLTLDEFYDYIKNNKSIPENSILITFDDGYVDNYTNAYPVLKEFGFNATIFVITDMIGNHYDYLTRDQIKEMSQNGIDIASHTAGHENLLEISKKNQVETLKKSKEVLEDITGKKIEYVAYPFGDFNDITIEATKEVGYKMAFSTIRGWSDGNDDSYKIKRVYISAFISDEDFKSRVSNPNYKR